MEFNVKDFKYHESLEQLVAALASKANTKDYHFVRVAVLFYLGIITAGMRTKLLLAGDRPVPLNIYGIILAPSGAGKGVITGTMEDLLSPFVKEFRERWKKLSEDYIIRIATYNSQKHGTDLQEETDKIRKELHSLGEPMVWFEESTDPAYKQMRSALARVGFGSLNFIVDEVLSVNYGEDILQSAIKSYDVGSLKSKLLKNSPDNKRILDDPTALVPSQMLLFGTGSLLEDPNVHASLMTHLRSGLARRSIFSYSEQSHKVALSAAERFNNLNSTNNTQLLSSFKNHVTSMYADKWFNYALDMLRSTHLYLIEYQMWCETRASAIDDPILKVEMEHRYMRVARIAGIYAVWDNETTVTIQHIQSAIKVVEDSGEALGRLTKSTPPHIKLAKYLAAQGEVTTSQIVTDLPWFGAKTKAVKNELIQLATEYGHTHNIIISSSTRRGIDYLKGNIIQPADMNKLILSLSDHQAYNYVNGYVSWGNLHTLVTKQGYHWVNHWFNNGHRQEEEVIEGFNLVVIDVDNKPNSPSNVPIHLAHSLLKDYTYLLYESKSSTDDFNRYRIILPISHTLQLSSEVYAEFMTNIYKWLPFPSDEVTNQRARKWLGYDKSHTYHEGTILNALDFLPDTERQMKKFKRIDALTNMDNLDRWFVTLADDPEHGRNNALIKYGLLLLDAGQDFDSIESAILTLNSKLATPVTTTEIGATIMKTIASKLAKQ